jgi:hypothetical protein
MLTGHAARERFYSLPATRGKVARQRAKIGAEWPSMR